MAFHSIYLLTVWLIEAGLDPSLLQESLILSGPGTQLSPRSADASVGGSSRASTSEAAVMVGSLTSIGQVK